MKKTTDTFHLRHTIRWLFSSVMVVALAVCSWAQPNCHDVNSGANLVVEGDEFNLLGFAPGTSVSVVGLGDFLNIDDFLMKYPSGIDVQITNAYGGYVQVGFIRFGMAPAGGSVTGIQAGNLKNVFPEDRIVVDACRHRGEELKVTHTGMANGGSCWGKWTFKLANAPVIQGRKKTVWCFDPLVQGGHIHDIPPTAIVPCRGEEDAQFVADWVDAFECDAAALGTEANDTAKIIYREYEAFSKEGIRGSNFDTIIVLRLPQITETNSFCPEKDTVYCGAGGKLGPYMIKGRTFSIVPDDEDIRAEIGDYDVDKYTAVSFIESKFNPNTRELEFKAAEFDPKCGINVHVDAWKLDGGQCSQQYKVTVEIKQSCWGTGGIYNGTGSADVTDFAGTFHPKFWEYSRKGSNNIEWDGNENVWAGAGFNPGLKDVGPVANTVALDPTTKMCASIPQTGTIEVDASDDEGYYTINGGSKVPLASGTNTIEVEVCDEICFLGPDNGEVELSNFSYTESAVPDGPLEALEVEGYWKCEFWVVDLDTVAPEVECKLDYANPDFVDEKTNTVYVPASSHDCAAHTYVPPVEVIDDWAGVKLVKAIIPGINTVVMERGDEENCWISHKQIKIPHGDVPTPVYYEAFDSCHNLGRDTCYLLVKDLTRPVPVCDKGVTIGLSGKKVWVDAETFDEGSWDNCGIALKLARRTDWYEHCVDLCDDVTAECWNDHYDTLYCANLEEDKHKEPVEAHYYKTMKWLKEDGRPCTDLIWNAWRYDLCKYATLHCKDHPYEVDDHYFRQLLKESGRGEVSYDDDKKVGDDKPTKPVRRLPCSRFLFESSLGTGSGGAFGADDIEERLDLYGDIGGGWSDAVPFDCEDACKNVTVELLVVDYWCNWAKCWENVWVEDKTPVTVKYDVQDIDITCGAYKQKKYEFEHSDHPVSASYLVDLAKEGDKYALAKLDELFGGYDKVWVDEYGNTPDRRKGSYWDEECICKEFSKKTRVYDEHLGYVWETTTYDSCWVKHNEVKPNWGQIVVNCAAYCEQEVWCDFDHCGQGYIFRKWKFVPGCVVEGKEGHALDTITRKQVIWVGNECELHKGMFDKPADTMVVTCGIEYDDAGNATGALDPSVIGAPVYKFDDDCRIVGITHSDKVFKVVGGDEACYKIVRSWHFMDWCYLGGKPENDKFWWLNPEYEGKKLHWEQKIIVKDTTAPVCTFAEELDVVDAPGCYYTLNQDVTVSDACGVLNYHWELHSVKGSDKTLIEEGQGDLEGDSSSFNITVADLGTGDYKLKVRVRDECQNESYCEDDFEVVAGKKPAAICITSLTAELTPWDIDQDGTIDSAKATIWASEFNSSSAPACGSNSELEYRIEIIDGIGDDTFEDDGTSLDVTCDHVGTVMIRLWVIDPSGSHDFCDVILVVQNNMGGCGDVSASNNTIVGEVTNELNQSVEQVNIRAEMANGQQLSYLTTASGAYAFAAALGLDVRVVPEKDLSDLNGITTLDLVKIQKHILGKEVLENDYRKIAADANADSKINTVDLIQLRKLILGKDDKLPENTSWRFFDAQSNKEQYVISNLDGLMELDWIGVKIGDVNLDSDPSRSAGRSSNNLVMSLDDEIMTAGNEYQVEFRAGAFNDITGYQYTLQFNSEAVSVSDITMGDAIGLTEENFSLEQVAEGYITSSWNSFEGVTMPNEEVLFTLTLKAKQGAQLSDVLSVNSRKTAAEAYNSLDQVASVALSFDNEKLITNEFALFQNNPNPFMESTVIGFNLPGESTVDLTIFDITGKAIYSAEGDFAKGYNQFSVSAKQLGGHGVLYYQIDTDEYTATKKMIVVE